MQGNSNEPSEREAWPICKVEGCTNRVDPRRVVLLGSPICLDHGEQRKAFTVAPAYNKGGLQLITPGNIKDIGKS